MFICACWLQTTSNEPSANERSSASACTTVMRSESPVAPLSHSAVSQYSALRSTVVTINDLGLLDEFHLLGRAATTDLANLAALQAEDHLLDIEVGLGGTARLLAQNYGCHGGLCRLPGA